MAAFGRRIYLEYGQIIHVPFFVSTLKAPQKLAISREHRPCYGSVCALPWAAPPSLHPTHPSPLLPQTFLLIFCPFLGKIVSHDVFNSQQDG